MSTFANSLQSRSKADLRATCETLARIVAEFQWMAKRYASGRLSYAPGVVNQHTQTLLNLGIECNPCAEGTIWAEDGAGRRVDGLDAEHLMPGHPVATGRLIGLLPRTRLADELLRLLDLPADAGIAAAVEKVMELQDKARVR